MTAATPIPALVAELTALAGDRSLPRRRVRIAQDIAAKLRQPARLTLIGLPDAPIAEIANALLGEGMFDPDWPTAQLTQGPAEAWTATLTDRSQQTGTGRPDPAGFPAPAAFLDLTAPLPQLQDRSLLVVRPRGGQADVQAALAWAARRTDITIWCSLSANAAELALWQAAPPALTNHGFLALAGTPVPATATGHFCESFRVDAPGGIDALDAALATLIAEARAEDAAAARLFLDQASVRRDSAPRPPQSAATADILPLAPAPDPETGEQDSEVAALLGRAFLHLRRVATDLLHLSDGTDPDADLAEAVLATLEDALTALADMLRTAEAAGVALPDLAEAVDAAAETTVLLRCEGGLAPASEGAALLVQLRQDIETHLEQAA